VPRTKLLLDRFLPYRLSVASNAVSQVIARAYESTHDLSMQEWRVIAVLGEAERLTQQGIVAKTKMDKVTVSRAARSLEDRGIVRREANEDDARSLWLSLTAEGRKIYVKVIPAAVELEREVFRGLSAKEIADLAALLVRVEDAADRVLAK
jgi:DNA-binding MarR family transcriptional regulator